MWYTQQLVDRVYRKYVVRLPPDQLVERVMAGGAASKVEPTADGFRLVAPRGSPEAQIELHLDRIDSETTAVSIRPRPMRRRTIVGLVVASLGFAAMLRIPPIFFLGGWAFIPLALVTIWGLNEALGHLRHVTAVRHELCAQVDRILNPYRISETRRPALPFRT